MKNILGLDLGPNSIGWAKVTMDDNNELVHDIMLGSRIIPMSQDVLGNFDKGISESEAKKRTGYRGIRRLRERSLLRRERLHRVLHVMGFLPSHYDSLIGWDKNRPATLGKFLDNSEPKLAWCRDESGRMRFLFMDSFNEMLSDFERYQPDLLAEGKKIPMDWTLYYLRKKALTEAITKEELAWILLNFNQKRGYYQLRGEEEEGNPTKKEEYHELKVVSVEATDEKKGDSICYHLHLENGWIYPRSSKVSLADWAGKVIQLIVTTEYEKDGVTLKKDKDGNVKRSFKAPAETDWALVKKRTENNLMLSGKTVGAFIYDHLLREPSDKIRGGLVKTIERHYYKSELRQILDKQCEFHAELRDGDVLKACVQELYAKNVAHQQSLLHKDIVYLLLDDLLFYQRPLKSKKSLIGDCPYEMLEYVDRSTGEVKKQGVKCVAVSNPYFQEFRLWQFITNLRLFDRSSDRDVTSEYLENEESYAQLFDYLNDRKEIQQDTLLKDFFRIKKVKTPLGQEFPIRWNYSEDKEKTYPCNTTRHAVLQALNKAGIEPRLLDDFKRLYRLWHLLYSIETKQEAKGALSKLWDDEKFWKDKNPFTLSDKEAFVSAFLQVKTFKKDYGAYSEKAIKKLLPLMRRGKYWSEDAFSADVKEQIGMIIRGEINEPLEKRLKKDRYALTAIPHFQGLPVWLACYVVYGRHSEVQEVLRWESPDSLMSYIRGFKYHSLRNPIVEQCVLETLRTVHDIWKEVGHIDEIHVELGREMKGTAEQRRQQTKRIQENENTNLRIKALLMELKNDASIADVRPYSPSQQELLRIYEEGALLQLDKNDENFGEISKISQKAQPTVKELERYKLWLDQKYCSPYTKKMIPLSKLFTEAYQIEHIIPQSRYFDNSFSNKVICESEVNQLKSNLLGYEFIEKHGGELVTCSAWGQVQILKAEEYKDFVEKQYARNKEKKRKLLMTDIPEDFINRQLNDTRYISKVVQALLSNLVRKEGEIEANSKFVIACTGGITGKLKDDWGLNDVWNKLVYPRFERLNHLTGTEQFGRWENKDGKRVFQTSMPLELERGYKKKRIDHRHHALDALIIACASKNVINYLNNESAQDSKRREDLRQKLCDKNRQIRKPWPTFTQDAYKALENVVVSFKNNIRVLSKATNRYERYDDKGRKVRVAQKGNDLWVVRKPLHKETVYGRVNLRRKESITLSKALDRVKDICHRPLRRYIQELESKGFSKKQILAHFKDTDYRWNKQHVDKVEVWYNSEDKTPMIATRKPLDASFDAKKITSITDTGIQKILTNYLKAKGGDPAVAFTPEAIADLNASIQIYNDGKWHQPIRKVRVAEILGAKYSVGYRGNRDKKIVEAQSGTNLYFAIYEDAEGKRSYATIPLAVVIERQKQQLSPVPEKKDDGTPLKFYLSPNDLVYVPTEDEQTALNGELDKGRIYKVVSFTEGRIFFIPYYVAKVIYDKVEFLAQNKIEFPICKDKNTPTIKSVCWKLEVDRLGNIIKIIK